LVDACVGATDGVVSVPGLVLDVASIVAGLDVVVKSVANVSVLVALEADMANCLALNTLGYSCLVGGAMLARASRM
jgi:hypothetical protein